MVIGDDEIEAELARATRRLGAADAAVDRDHDVHAFGMQPLEGGGLQAVAIPQPLGNEVRDLPAQKLDRAS